MKIFGLEIDVPLGAGFVSRDSDGLLMYHTEKPHLSRGEYLSVEGYMVEGIEPGLWDSGSGYISLDANGAYASHDWKPTLDDDGWWSGSFELELFEPLLYSKVFGLWIIVPEGVQGVKRDLNGTLWGDGVMLSGVEPDWWAFEDGFISLNTNGTYMFHALEPTLGGVGTPIELFEPSVIEL